MESLGLPVLTDHARFGILEIGEEFYLPGEPIRYVKTGKHTGQIPPSANFQTYAQLEFEPRWKVWRRIEP